jgi:hypothetical protein
LRSQSAAEKLRMGVISSVPISPQFRTLPTLR